MIDRTDLAPLAGLSYLQAADLSPDGRTVAYTLRRPTDGDDVVELWVQNVGGDARRVDIEGTPAAVCWSPDGATLATTVGDGATTQVWLVHGHRGEPLTSFPRGIAGTVAWSPDGGRIAVGVRRPEATDLGEPHRIDRVPWHADAAGRLDDLIADIHLVDVHNGETTALTEGPTIDRDPVFSPDGERLLFVRSHEPGELRPVEHLAIVDAAGATTPVPWQGGIFATGRFMDDGGLVVMSHRQADRGRGEAPDLYVLGPDGSSDNRTAGLDLALNGILLGDMPTPINDPNRFLGIYGGEAIVAVHRGGTLGIDRVALAGERRVAPVVDGERSWHPLALRDSLLLCAAGTMQAPPELYLVDLSDGSTSQVTDINGAVLPEPLAIDRLDVVAPDGTAVEAWFVHPPDGAAPYPTVLLIHGGPFCAFGEEFYADAQLLARSGFGVIMANPRGSTGYGSAFATATRGAWGGADYADLMAVVDAAVALGLADPDRLGVNGLSYGGYMTAWIVTHTDRFGAAVAENPVTDLLGFRGTSDIGISFTDDAMGGPPAERREVYLACSPLTYADRCGTPTRLIVSEADRRCPPVQGEQFFSALREAGCETDMIRLPGASHAGSVLERPAVRRAQDAALLEWMHRHLM